MELTLIKQLVWLVYGLAALGLIAGLIKLLKAWHPGLRNLLVCACIGGLLIPWQVNAEQPDLAPAFMVSLFDGLSLSPEEAMRAGTPLLLGSLLIMLLGQVAGLLLGSRMTRQNMAKKAAKASNISHK